MKGSADLLFRSAVRGKPRGVRPHVSLDGKVAPLLVASTLAQEGASFPYRMSRNCCRLLNSGESRKGMLISALNQRL